MPVSDEENARAGLLASVLEDLPYGIPQGGGRFGGLLEGEELAGPGGGQWRLILSVQRPERDSVAADAVELQFHLTAQARPEIELGISGQFGQEVPARNIAQLRGAGRHALPEALGGIGQTGGDAGAKLVLGAIPAIGHGHALGGIQEDGETARDRFLEIETNHRLDEEKDQDQGDTDPQCCQGVAPPGRQAGSATEVSPERGAGQGQQKQQAPGER